jgi:hypothetical protein
MNQSYSQYLESDVVEKEDSVEKIFCQNFSKLKTEPLTQDLSKTLISLFFIEEDDPEIIGLINNMLNDKHKYSNMVLHILKKRFCEIYNFSFENRLLILLSQTFDSPGKAVMYGTYFAYWAKKNNKNKITLNDFCEKIFPFGLPTEEEISKLWIKQKVKCEKPEMKSDNLLDYYKATISLVQ